MLKKAKKSLRFDPVFKGCSSSENRDQMKMLKNKKYRFIWHNVSQARGLKTGQILRSYACLFTKEKNSRYIT